LLDKLNINVLKVHSFFQFFKPGYVFIAEWASFTKKIVKTNFYLLVEHVRLDTEHA